MKLDESSFEELFKTVDPKTANRNVNMGKQSVSVSVYPLSYSV